ncbi:MAG: TIGR04282 family arsenosugar biosynthesis glycosyltransferase [Acidobacteriota bacterium]
MSATVVVFGREPVPGRVKTRLAAEVGPARAAAVYAALLAHTLEQAQHSGLDAVLALAEPASAAWRPPASVPVEVQTGGDLGARMAASFARHFRRGAETVVLVGSDCPYLLASHLRAAAAACLAVDVVLGPALDGGYWLLGQRAPGADLFTGVPWSSPLTLDATRGRLAALGVSHRELESLRDVDDSSGLDSALSLTGAAPGVREAMRRALLDPGVPGGRR